jgi:hypothetical protein
VADALLRLLVALGPDVLRRIADAIESRRPIGAAERAALVAAAEAQLDAALASPRERGEP